MNKSSYSKFSLVLAASFVVMYVITYPNTYEWDRIAQAGALAVILGKKNWLVPIEHDAEIYKERNQIERAISGLKRFRAVATRFDKRAANYFATCCLIAALTSP